MSDTPASTLGIHGVMIVRNEWDLIVFNLLHHLRLGLDRIHVVDNGSTDGTERLLETMSRVEPISVTRQDGPFEQKRITNELAQTAREMGAKWIVPIDADEFWDPGPKKLGTIFRRCKDEESGRRVAALNYFVPSSERIPRAGCALQARWTAGETFEHTMTNRDQILEGKFPVSLIDPWPKCFIRADRGLAFELGGHKWKGMSPKARFAADLVIRHLPNRHHGKILERRMAGERILVSREYVPGNNWHLIRLVAMNETELAAEWKASTVHRGMLRHGGRSFPMLRDDSLHHLVRPLRTTAREIYRQADINPRMHWHERLW